MKRLLLISIVMLVTVAVFGATVQAQDEPVTLLWSMWGSPEELATHQAVADAFMAANPDVQVELLGLPWGDYFTRVQTLWAAGDPEEIPDVSFLSPIQGYAASGVLEPLNPFIEESGFDLEDYWPDAVRSTSLDGTIYGLPRDIGVEVLYYNIDHFEEAGLDIPDETWTWDDLRAAAETLSVIESSGRVSRYGLAMEGGKYFNFVGSNGGGIFDSVFEPTSCQLSSPASMEAFDFFAGMMEDNLAMRDANLGQAGGDLAVFLAGQTSMFIQNASRIPALNEAGINYDVAPVPTAPGGTRQAGSANGAAWAMSSFSDNKEVAWQFIEFLQSAEGGLGIYSSTGEAFPPTRAGAMSDSFLNMDRGPAGVEAFVMQAETANINNNGWFVEWTEIRDTLVNPTLSTIWSGEVAPADVLPGLCEDVDAFLRDAGY